MLKEDRESGQDRIDNLKELKEDIAQSMIEDPEMTLESYLQDIALFTDKTQETSENTVSLMTVHAAKGLEFDTVFLVNFNDGVFPSSRACDEGGMKALEEERRLLYVAMTRAKKHYTLHGIQALVICRMRLKHQVVLELKSQWNILSKKKKKRHQNNQRLSFLNP